MNTEARPLTKWYAVPSGLVYAAPALPGSTSGFNALPIFFLVSGEANERDGVTELRNHLGENDLERRPGRSTQFVQEVAERMAMP